MENTTIFVEGTADTTFIKQYIKSILGIDLKGNDIISVDGWTNLINETKSGEAFRVQMERNKLNGGKNLVVFDADNDFNERYAEIIEWKTKYELDFELFLFPNNTDTGALENLLESIINPANQPIFDCWDSFERCIQSKTIEGRVTPLTIPAKKTKIYGYLETLHGTTKSEKDKIKDPNRDYLNANYWNLESENLDPLKDFLTNNL